MTEAGRYYEQLGIRPVINASATLTALGGSLMPDEVVAAMGSAARSFIDLQQLQDRVGARLAELTGNEAGFVSCGAAAGITLAVAACLVGADPEQRHAFPDISHLSRDEVVIARRQRNAYDYAARVTGARILETDGTPAGLQSVLTARTACVLVFAGFHYGVDHESVRQTVAVARCHGVPVLVDAAAQIPPVSSLWTFTRDDGADAVIVSGGKGLRGPQASGLVLGSEAIVAGCRANGNPNSAIGRSMKVGKEELVGLLAAVERYLAQDEDELIAGYERSVRRWIDGLDGHSGLTASRGYPSEAGQPYGRALVRFGPDAPIDRDTAVRRLWEGDPPVAVGVIGADQIALNPQTLAPGEDELVLRQILAVVRPQ